MSGKADNKKVIPDGVFTNSALLMLTEPRLDNQNKTLSNDDSNQITENFIEMNLSITKNQTSLSTSDQKIFLEWLQTKANSWRENKITDYKFLTDIANVLDSPNPSLFLKHIENLSFKELISKAEEYQRSGDYRNSLSFYNQALFSGIDSSEMKIKALTGKGSVLISMGEYDNAIKHYDLALEFEPDNVELIKMKAFTLAQLGLLDEARNYFEAAKQIKSE